MDRTWGQRIAWALALTLALSTTALAQQSARRGEINGTVKDDTGAVLPGVTVTVSGPALQVPQLVGVSDEKGEYRVVELPPGTYTVRYEISGFGTLVREGITLSSGFVARLDAQLKVATLSETITVSGESPVVDVTTTRGGAIVSKELLAALPTNNNFRDVMLMVGGMQANNAPLTGGEQAAALGFAGASYGAGTGVSMVEGMRMMSFQPANFSAYEEVDVKTFGNTADVDQSGAAVNLVVKSGGNQFHGRYTEVYMSDNFASDNIDDRLRAQGIDKGDSVVWFSDFTADLGGRVVRDKLWFYANTRVSDNKYTSSGFVAGPGPDGVYGTKDEPTAFPTDRFRGGIAKVSYQATPKNKFIFLWHENNNHYFAYYTRYAPLESTVRHNQIGHEIKPLEWQAALSNRWLINAQYGYSRFAGFRYWNGGWQPNSGAASTFDRSTLQQTGPAWNDNVLGSSWLPRYQWSGSVSYLPGGDFLGSHSLQAGYRVWLAHTSGTYPGGGPEDGCTPGGEVCPANVGIGQYQLVFDTVNNVPHQPVEIIVKNWPLTGSSHDDKYALYLMDTWRPTSRLTLNLGFRFERNYYWVDDTAHTAVAPVGFVEPIGPSFDVKRFTVNDWKVPAPRFGAAYDLTGDGKTVVKGTWGRFYTDLQTNTYSPAYSPASTSAYDYRWNDINKDNKYQPGEVNLSTSGPDFVSVTGGLNRILNPDLNLTYTDEASGSVERQLGQGFSLRGLYVYKRAVDVFQSINVKRPFSVYDQAFKRKDLGPDALLNTPDDGPVYTLYDYNPAYRGAAFVQNQYVDADQDRHDKYHSVEMAITKRPSGGARWFANTSLLSTRTEVWRVKAVSTPNDNVLPVSTYWDFTYLLAGGYNFPRGITVSSMVQAYNGLARARVNQYRAVDPEGGPRFPSTTNLQLPAETAGSTRGPQRTIMNIRAAKDFRLGGGRKVVAGVDAMNFLNTNVAWGSTNNTASNASGFGAVGISDFSGPSYNQILVIVQPRQIRFNVAFEF